MTSALAPAAHPPDAASTLAACTASRSEHVPSAARTSSTVPTAIVAAEAAAGTASAAAITEGEALKALTLAGSDAHVNDLTGPLRRSRRSSAGLPDHQQQCEQHQ